MLRKLKGFTLIELLIVIAIIAILTVAFLPALRGGQNKARDAARKAVVSDLTAVIESRVIDATLLPPETVLTAQACLFDFTALPGSKLAEWLGRVPEKFVGSPFTLAADHLCSGQWVWYRKISGSSYVLAVEMETVEAANSNIIGTAAERVAAVTNIASPASVIAATTGSPPAAGPWFYIVGK